MRVSQRYLIEGFRKLLIQKSGKVLVYFGVRPMKVVFIISLAFLGLSALSLPQTALARLVDCEVNGKSVDPNNGNTTNGVTGLMRCVERDSRLIAREQALVNGDYVGVNKFYERGKLIRDGNVNAKGNRDGSNKTYSQSGVLLTDEVYLNGANVGLQKSFYDTGALRRLSFYEKRNNSASAFVVTDEIASIEFTPKGKLRDVRCATKPVITFEKYSDNQLCGFSEKATVELFSGDTLEESRTIENGKFISRDWFWPDGKPSGQFIRNNEKITERRFNRAGVKISELVSSEKGSGRARELEQLFHTSGVLISEKQWGSGGLSSESTWYLNGQLKTKQEYLPTSVLKKEYFDSGKLAFEGNYGRNEKRFQAVNEHKYFFESGKLRREIFYDADGKVTRERDFDESGTVTRDDAVFEDGSRKQFSR
jgi:antitoxin component YwqK of YwqJK toxin-antitoxin module